MSKLVQNRISSLPAVVTFYFLPSIRIPRDNGVTWLQTTCSHLCFLQTFKRFASHSAGKQTTVLSNQKKTGRHTASLLYVQLSGCRQREQVCVWCDVCVAKCSGPVKWAPRLSAGESNTWSSECDVHKHLTLTVAIFNYIRHLRWWQLTALASPSPPPPRSPHLPTSSPPPLQFVESHCSNTPPLVW